MKMWYLWKWYCDVLRFKTKGALYRSRSGWRSWGLFRTIRNKSRFVNLAPEIFQYDISFKINYLFTGFCRGHPMLRSNWDWGGVSLVRQSLHDHTGGKLWVRTFCINTVIVLILLLIINCVFTCRGRGQADESQSSICLPGSYGTETTNSLSL